MGREIIDRTIDLTLFAGIFFCKAAFALYSI